MTINQNVAEIKNCETTFKKITYHLNALIKGCIENYITVRITGLQKLYFNDLMTGLYVDQAIDKYIKLS